MTIDDFKALIRASILENLDPTEDDMIDQMDLDRHSSSTDELFEDAAEELADMILSEELNESDDTVDEERGRGSNVFTINTGKDSRIGALGAGVSADKFAKMSQEEQTKVITDFINRANQAIAARYYIKPKGGQKRPPSRVLRFLGVNNEEFAPYKQALKTIENELGKLDRKLAKQEKVLDDPGSSEEKLTAANEKIGELEVAKAKILTKQDDTAQLIKDKLATLTDPAKVEAMAKEIANPEGFSVKSLLAITQDDGPQALNKLMNLLDSYKIIAYKGSTKSTPETDEEELNESSGPFIWTHPWAYGPDDEFGQFTYSDEIQDLAKMVADKMGGEVEGYGIEGGEIVIATNGTEYIVDRQGNVKPNSERPSFTGLPFTEEETLNEILNEMAEEDKAKLYFMGLVKKGVIDRLPDESSVLGYYAMLSKGDKSVLDRLRDSDKQMYTEEETPMLRGIEDGKFKPGDSVVFKGGANQTQMKVLRVRRDSGLESGLELVTVVGPLGKTGEFKETELIKVNKSLNENMEQQAKAFFLQLLKKGAIDNLPAEGDIPFLYTQLMMANADGDIEAVEDILYNLRDDRDELFADRDDRTNMDPDEAQLADEDEMFNSYDDDGAPLEETLNEGKMNTKKIEEVGKRASVEAKLAYVNELIEEMTSRLTTLEEDEGMAEMMDKKKLKEMKKNIKLMERMKAKLEKEYAKLEGKGKAKEEAIIDEDEEVNLEELFGFRKKSPKKTIEDFSFELNGRPVADIEVSADWVTFGQNMGARIGSAYYADTGEELTEFELDDLVDKYDELKRGGEYWKAKGPSPTKLASRYENKEPNLEELANSINETTYKIGDQDVVLNKGKDPSGIDWTVTFQNGDTTPLNDVLALIKPFPDGLTAGSVGLFENTTLYKTMQRRAGIS